VLTICLGKSTYARCFSGNTRVALVGGAAATLEDMARRADDGELFRGYSVAANGRVVVSRLEAPRWIGRDSLIEIELDNGATIAATPDHEFMLRDGRMAPAGSLRPGRSLMPLYREPLDGREMVYQPLTGGLVPTRRLEDEWSLRCGRHAAGARGHPRRAGFARPTRMPQQIARWPGGASGRNHEVVALRDVPGEHDVYCLTVPEAGNFALDAGVFVHNCGIIVNVTPFEPEWEGFVTLEFSNTTPLPAKIYANEGVAQVIFFESDEVCETSYKDRGGKYQGQQGVTLPKL
jgi:hypothetical protein